MIGFTKICIALRNIRIGYAVTNKGSEGFATVTQLDYGVVVFVEESEKRKNN